MTGLGEIAPDRPLTHDPMRSASVAACLPDAAARLAARLGPGPFALIVLFISPEADLDRLRRDLGSAFPGTRVVGCSTAGEISEAGYDSGRILACAFPSDLFAAETVLIPDLSALKPDDLAARLFHARQGLARRHPDWAGEFAFLMVDGLSAQEDALAACLSSGLGPVPMIGGSAGDGTRFRRTFVLQDGVTLANAAVLSILRTDCALRVFNLDHLRPTARRMVVTEADPARRIVRRINAEPAAREYARLLGKDPAQLGPFTFAAHPLVVRLGGRHHVRAIRQVAANGDLVFFSAIDEGLVLTLAEPLNIATHLEGELARLAAPVPPSAILACDCMLRRIEAEQSQAAGAVSDLFRRYNLRGFSTYGEQVGALHVNQTLTGVAFYPPGTVLA